VEDDKLELAKSLEAKAKEHGVALLLPTDVVVADKFAADANAQIVSVDNIPSDGMGLDIGPDSVKCSRKRRLQIGDLEWTDGSV
jgi:phosphoglycerate kinase